MKLSEAVRLARLDASLLFGDAEVDSVALDSRKTLPNALFIAMPGAVDDGERFIPDAIGRGASAVVARTKTGLVTAIKLGAAAYRASPEQPAFNDAIWRLLDAVLDHPSRDMQTIGVTGTNGKTTTAWIGAQMLNKLGRNSAYIGTLGVFSQSGGQPLNNTTPYAAELYPLIAGLRDRQVDSLAMEVSSHALQERRCDGIEFDVGVFTNLTQDHLDFHGTMAAYQKAKLRLFTEIPKQSSKRFCAVLNIDDPTGRSWFDLLDGRKVAFSCRDHAADLFGEAISVTIDSIEMRFEWRSKRAEALIPLGGRYNVENSVAAMAAILSLDYPLSSAVEAISSVMPVPGRFESVANDKGIGVIVDYAHTPDAIQKLLTSVRELSPGRIITVFGCGGDRDRSKRPRMAAVASRLSELTIITTDNPRTEDAAEIASEVQSGIVSGRDSEVILDRGDAVVRALAYAERGDVVVIAGKGHETYQIVARERLHMDDRELAREAIRRL